jgi:hypothetical protein
MEFLSRSWQNSVSVTMRTERGRQVECLSEKATAVSETLLYDIVQTITSFFGTT